MHNYFIKTPWWLKKIFPQYTWSLNGINNEVYLTFDDGPHATITPWILDELKKHNAKASFFCIGKNVVQHPEIYQRILREGHAVGNHTHNHLNGWKVTAADYMEDIKEASIYIESGLFRPPYGRITQKQFRCLKDVMNSKVKVILWDVLSADFDQSITPERCLAHVCKNVTSGSVIVFHDSEKASRNIYYALPRTLEFLISKGYRCKKIEE